MRERERERGGERVMHIREMDGKNLVSLFDSVSWFIQWSPFI